MIIFRDDKVSVPERARMGYISSTLVDAGILMNGDSHRVDLPEGSAETRHASKGSASHQYRTTKEGSVGGDRSR
jgi:hypothetical protein